MLLRDGEPVIYVERGGKGILLLARLDEEELAAALAALVAGGRATASSPKLGVEKVDGEPVLGSGFEEALIEAGFSRQPRRLVAAG